MSSQNDDDEISFTEHKCFGYSDDNGTQRCDKRFYNILKLENGASSHYFCKGSHLCRYLIKHFTGRSSKKQKIV